MPVPDLQLVALACVSAAATYVVLSVLSPKGLQVPLLAAVFVASNMFSRTQTFGRSVNLGFRLLGQGRPLFGSTAPSSPEFAALSEVSQSELLEAVTSLEAYGSQSKKANERRKKLFRMMLWRQQKLADEAGYSAKLRRIDTHIERNQAVLAQAAQAARAAYALSYRDFAQLKPASPQKTSASNYRVLEAMGHFVRDWTPTGDAETAPMLAYIKAQLDALIPESEAARTVVVVPGLGLGRVAHEIARHRPYAAVHAVEFSGLMHACHRFVYTRPHATLFPYVHTCSNFVSTAAQFRGVDVRGAEQPDNLHLWLDDFRYFAPEPAHNVVVVLAFFVDTAENLVDYLDQILQLTAPSKKAAVRNGYWINFGPLKYGSAAQVELNADELAHVRRRMGWVDVDAAASLASPDKLGGPLVGYSTDRESMWQGYYGVAMWAAAQKGNERTPHPQS